MLYEKLTIYLQNRSYLQNTYKIMATFSACIRNQSSDGYYNVYIRVVHKGSPQYIKTSFRVNQKGLRTVYNEKGDPKLEICDNFVLKECLIIIEGYFTKINRIDSSKMDCKSVVSYLKEPDEISFTDFAKKYIDKMYNEGRNPCNYKMAVARLKEFYKKEDISFKEIKSKKLREWIDSMKGTARAKNLYPTCIKTIFTEGKKEYNDDEDDIIRIPNDPFSHVKIPDNSIKEQTDVRRKDIRKFFKVELTNERDIIAKDVCLMSFCLCGVNEADLYDCEKGVLKNWKLTYYRKKTRDKTPKYSKTVITVPEIIRPLFKKYKGKEKLLNFSERYSTPKGFVHGVSDGVKEILIKSGLSGITFYSFRRAWSTIAQSDLGASTELVGFCLVHAPKDKVTEGYFTRKNYDPVDTLNSKVIKYVLGRVVKRSKLIKIKRGE